MKLGMCNYLWTLNSKIFNSFSWIVIGKMYFLWTVSGNINFLCSMNDNSCYLLIENKFFMTCEKYNFFLRSYNHVRPSFFITSRFHGQSLSDEMRSRALGTYVLTQLSLDPWAFDSCIILADLNLWILWSINFAL